MKIGIVTVSSAYLSQNYMEKYDIKVAELTVNYENESTNESLITNEYLFKLLDDGIKVTTSQPSPQMFADVYTQSLKTNDKVVVFVLSSKLSGAYQSALNAVELVDTTCEIEVIDTMTAAMGIEAIIAETVIDIENKVSFSNIINNAKELAKKLPTYLVIDDLAPLVRGGRLSLSAALIGRLLRVKPLLKLDMGSITVFEKIKTQKRVYGRIAELMFAENEIKAISKVYITYATKAENALLLKSVIEEKLKNTTIKICEEVGPVLSVHLGRGGVGVSWV